MNSKLPIFVGLPMLTVYEATELAIYWKLAGGDAKGIITKRGYLKYGENQLWERPCANTSFEVLKKALEGSNIPWVTVEESEITIDFSKIQYNLDWVKEIIQKHGLGVCDNEDKGPVLELYELKNSHGNPWYAQGTWRIRRVTVADLGLSEARVCPVSPNQANPRTAEWKTLYFA